MIVAHFYDIESGRKDLAARGRSDAHEMVSIPIHRDGGITDLLAEAERPDRRFDHVICESIDRIARRTVHRHRHREPGSTAPGYGCWPPTNPSNSPPPRAGGSSRSPPSC